ncbi:hypothetical protein KP509_14G036900 [Ceratopteris richardii]|uniref:Uncharacterized protein n=1 Tax=Ceratopteris richardii TaxID=49495 RepID=A0A8T2TBS4_CERRI|nr:hypothetical protein KP509_14G036900 [Ceratopteris richardii]
MCQCVLFCSQIQCSVCRAYHRGNVEGALIKDHVYVFENNVAVCEWCIASPCRACGVYFEGSMASATPGGWAVKGSQICVTCQLGRMAINSSPQDPCSMEFLTKLASSKVFQECSTCITKYKNSALVRELEQGISLSSERQNSSRGFFTASSSVPQHGSSLYCHYSDPFLQAQPYYNCMYPFANQSNPAQYTMGNSAFPPQIFPCNQPYGPYVASSHGGYHASNMPGMQQTIQPPSSAVGGISDMTGLIDQINAASTLASVLRMFINSSNIK